MMEVVVPSSDLQPCLWEKMLLMEYGQISSFIYFPCLTAFMFSTWAVFNLAVIMHDKAPACTMRT